MKTFYKNASLNYSFIKDKKTFLPAAISHKTFWQKNLHKQSSQKNLGYDLTRKTFLNSRHFANIIVIPSKLLLCIQDRL